MSFRSGSLWVQYATHLAHAFEGVRALDDHVASPDLHSEAAERIADTIKPDLLRATISKLLTNSRKLDGGNANEANLGPDFGRFGMRFFSAVDAKSRRNGTKPQLRFVRRWHRNCAELAVQFDQVVRDYIGGVVGGNPWE